MKISSSHLMAILSSMQIIMIVRMSSFWPLWPLSYYPWPHSFINFSSALKMDFLQRLLSGLEDLPYNAIEKIMIDGVSRKQLQGTYVHCLFGSILVLFWSVLLCFSFMISNSSLSHNALSTLFLFLPLSLPQCALIIVMAALDSDPLVPPPLAQLNVK